MTACSSFVPKDLSYSAIEVSSSRVMEYAVYTPPGWQADERLPLIVFLHGGGGSHHNFERYGANQYLDEKISAGKIPRAIIVLPNGDNGFWENWHDGTKQYRDWVMLRIVPEVQKQYGTLACPENCHLAGISMGGFGALRMAYYYPNEFSSVSAISAPVFSDQALSEQGSSFLMRLIFPMEKIFGPKPSGTYNSENPFNAWADDERLRDVRLQLVWGDRDSKNILKSNQLFRENLLAKQRGHDFHVYQGGHKWKYWVPELERVMNFLIQN